MFNELLFFEVAGAMNQKPAYYPGVETCVEETPRKVGRRIALGTPLGLGKANHLVNEFFRRARADPNLSRRNYLGFVSLIFRKTIVLPKQAGPYLERMAFDQPQTPKERLLQSALVYALASLNAI